MASTVHPPETITGKHADTNAPVAETIAGTNTVEAVPLEERVRQRAHRLYLKRGDKPGSPLDDWLRAEQEIQLEDHRQSAEL